MYAWVGANGKGVLVAFDPVNLVGYGLDEPGVRAALAHALGWFVDVSVSLRQTPGGTTSLRRAGAGSTISGYRYVPTPSHHNQVHQVAGGQSRPPRITGVQSHVRQLKSRKPSAAARSRAPRRLRDIMGPKDTFVRGHIKAHKPWASSTCDSQSTRCWLTSSAVTVRVGHPDRVTIDRLAVRGPDSLVCMAEFEQLWDRIRRHAGAEFHTVQGLPFTYEVPGSYLVITRNGEQINRSLSRTNFRKAAEQMPVSGPAALRDRQSSSYTWAILNDSRISAGPW